MFCSNGYAPSSDDDAPYISPSGRCYHRVSDSEADCSASYAGRSRICLCSSPCLEGYYGTSSQCRRCPPRSTSAAGNSFVTSCICEDGFYLVTDLEKPYGYVHCVIMKLLNIRAHHTYVYYTCILNTYTGTHSCTQRGLAHRGSGFCQKCPNYMHSPPGSTSMSDCKCKSGFYLKTGVFECIACPTGTTSPSGSTSQDDCKCAAGYYKTASQLNISCIRCPDSSDSAEGSATIEQCICPPGLGIAANSYSRRVTSPTDICGVEIRYRVAGIQHAMSICSSQFVDFD